MKTIKLLSIAILFGIAGISAVYAQDVKKQIKKGQIKLIIEDDKNGQITKCDSSISVEDKAKVEAILKEIGIDWDWDSSETNTFPVRFNENSFIMINEDEQDGETKVKAGQMKLMIKEDKNGNIVKFDSTFSLKDQAKIEEILKSKGIDWNAGNIDMNTIQMKSDNKAVIMINDEELDRENSEHIKIIRYESDPENGEEVNVELIVNEAVKEALEISNKFEFHSDENGEGKVIIMKNGELIEGDEFDFSGNGIEKVFIKKIVISKDQEGELTEIIKEIKGQSMVFIIKTDSKVEGKDNLLDTKIEEDNLKNLEISKLKLFPNPTNGLFKMSFKSKTAKDINITIVDIKGSVVYEKDLKQFKGKFSEEFDMSDQEKGIYLFNIVTGEERETRKIIVQ